MKGAALTWLQLCIEVAMFSLWLGYGITGAGNVVSVYVVLFFIVSLLALFSKDAAREAASKPLLPGRTVRATTRVLCAASAIWCGHLWIGCLWLAALSIQASMRDEGKKLLAKEAAESAEGAGP